MCWENECENYHERELQITHALGLLGALGEFPVFEQECLLLGFSLSEVWGGGELN